MHRRRAMRWLAWFQSARPHWRLQQAPASTCQSIINAFSGSTFTQPLPAAVYKTFVLLWRDILMTSLTCHAMKVQWNAHNTVFGSKCSAFSVQAVYFLHSTRPSVTWLNRVVSMLQCCQPASDVAENLGSFLARTVHSRVMTLNWCQR